MHMRRSILPALLLFAASSLVALASRVDSYHAYLPSAVQGFTTWDEAYLGHPPTPTVMVNAALPADFFTYDSEHQYIYERVLHGRPVGAVFEKDLPFTEAERDDIASYTFRTWSDYWDLYGGFPFQRFLVRYVHELRARSDTGIGFEVTAQDLLNERASINDWYAIIAHGLFHGWFGGDAAVRPASLAELWAQEGITTYYGNRYATRERYEIQMAHFYDVAYLQWILGTELDVPLVEAGPRFVGTANRFVYYDKGAVVAYLMDQQLLKEGLSLDDLIHYMYERYGLTNQVYTTADVLAALNAISSCDWTEFFDSYIYGIVPLPIENPIVFLEH